MRISKIVTNDYSGTACQATPLPNTQPTHSALSEVPEGEMLSTATTL